MKSILSNLKMRLSLLVISTAPLAFAAEGNAAGCLIAGSIHAPLTIEEFADFECSYCAKGSKTMSEVLKNYPGKVNLVFRNRPLSAHQNSSIAAKAFSAVCLQNPTLAYSYQKDLFDHQDRLVSEGESFLYEVAEKLGVDLYKMKFDMNSESVANSIKEDQKLGDSHNFKGTPSFMIGTEPIVGAVPYDEIKKVIDQQLNQ